MGGANLSAKPSESNEPSCAAESDALECEGWQVDERTALECGLVRTKADAGPVSGLRRVGERIAVLRHCHRKLVCQVRMAPAMTAALSETQMRSLAGIIDTLRSVFLNAPGKAPGEVRALDCLGNFWLR